jgi:predicted small lipoprotein YifL
VRTRPATATAIACLLVLTACGRQGGAEVTTEIRETTDAENTDEESSDADTSDADTSGSETSGTGSDDGMDGYGCQ